MKRLVIIALGFLAAVGFFSSVLAATLTITVNQTVDNKKQPVAQADVTITGNKKTTTDSKGKAVFKDLKVDQYSITATKTIDAKDYIGSASAKIDSESAQANATVTITQKSSSSEGSKGASNSLGSGIIDSRGFSGAKGLTEFIQGSGSVRTVWRSLLILSNIAVAVMLIGVAFATIFHIQVDTYGIKKVLPTLVAGIILANLSFLISTAIIDFAQILSATFINEGIGGSAGLIDKLSQAMIGGGFDRLGQFFTGTSPGPTSGAALTIAGIALVLAGLGGMLLVALVIFVGILILVPSLLFAILAFLLYVRIIVLVFLTAISPLAFIAMAFAPTQGLFRQWWTQFLKWAFMAPFVFFFLWLAAQFSETNFGGDGSLASYVLVVAMLYFAIQVPFKMGGAVMGVYGGVGKKLLGGGIKGAGFGVNSAVGKFGQSKLGKRLNIVAPSDFYKGLQEKIQTDRSRRESMGVARGRAIVEQATPRFVWGRLRGKTAAQGTTIYEQKALAKQAKDLEENYFHIQGAEQLNEAINKGPDHAIAAIRALVSHPDPEKRKLIDSAVLQKVYGKYGKETISPLILQALAQSNANLFDNSEADLVKRTLQSDRVDRPSGALAELLKSLNSADKSSLNVNQGVKEFFEGLNDTQIDLLKNNASPMVSAFMNEVRSGVYNGKLGSFESKVRSQAGSGPTPVAHVPDSITGDDRKVIHEIQTKTDAKSFFNGLTPDMQNNFDINIRASNLKEVSNSLKNNIDNKFARGSSELAGFYQSAGLGDKLKNVLDDLRNHPDRYPGGVSLEQSLKTGLSSPDLREFESRAAEITPIINEFGAQINSLRQGFKNIDDLKDYESRYGVSWKTEINKP